MKKFVLICGVVIIFVLYEVLHRQFVSAVLLNRNSSTGNITASTSGTSAGYKDGTYTGNSEDAFYGNVQVQAKIQNGKLADVEFLQYPNDRDESVQINQQAVPMLKQEAVQAQNVNVDIVSGATQTSQAFIKSLTSALAQAKS